MHKIKVVIVESQTDTDMVIAGTRYFDTEQLARNFVLEHNANSASCAYVVHVSPTYNIVDVG